MKQGPDADAGEIEAKIPNVGKRREYVANIETLVVSQHASLHKSLRCAMQHFRLVYKRAKGQDLGRV